MADKTSVAVLIFVVNHPRPLVIIEGLKITARRSVTNDPNVVFGRAFELKGVRSHFLRVLDWKWTLASCQSASWYNGYLGLGKEDQYCSQLNANSGHCRWIRHDSDRLCIILNGRSSKLRVCFLKHQIFMENADKELQCSTHRSLFRSWLWTLSAPLPTFNAWSQVNAPLLNYLASMGKRP